MVALLKEVRLVEVVVVRFVKLSSCCWKINSVDSDDDVDVIIDGMASKSKLEAPLKKVKRAMKIRKLPNLSARKPAKGGPKISAPGMTLLTIEASSMVNPRALRCIVWKIKKIVNRAFLKTYLKGILLKW